MLVNDDSISPEEKIKQLVEFEEGKRRELEEKRKEIEKKRKELEDLEKRGAQEIEEVRKEIEKRIKRAYKKARLKAEDETGIDKKHFPKSCPFSPDQILEKAFFPEEEI